MFHRGKSSERIERMGRYFHAINEMHQKGVYSSKEILLSLLQCYLDYQNRLLDSVVSVRGDVFKHAELVSKLKTLVTRLDEADYAAHVIKWFNTRHLRLNPNDDIFYLLSVFLSVYEWYLPKVNTLLRSRLTYQDHWARFNLKSIDPIQQLTHSVLALSANYQPYLTWLMKLIKSQHYLLSGEALKVAQGEFKKVMTAWRLDSPDLIPSQVERVRKKISLLAPVLPSELARWCLQLTIDLEKANKFFVENNTRELMYFLIKVQSHLSFFNPREKDKLIEFLIKLCDSIYIRFICDWLEKFSHHFTSQQLDLVIEKLITVFPDLSDFHKADVCYVLINFKKIKDNHINQMAGDFLASFILKKNKRDPNSLLLAANHFFLCDAAKSPLRYRVVETLYDWLVEEDFILIKTDILCLLLDEGENIPLEIPKLMAQLVDFGFSGTEQGEDRLKSVCVLLAILRSHMPPVERGQLIWSQIKILESHDRFIEKAAYILLSLKYFIQIEHQESIFNLILKWLKSDDICKNVIFVDFMSAMKSILPKQNLQHIAAILFTKFCVNPSLTVLPFSLISEFQSYFSFENCFHITATVINLICDGQPREVILRQELDRASACVFLQYFIPRLSVDQKIMLLTLVCQEMQKDNHFAGLLFLDIHYHYRLDIVSDILSRVKAESNRCLPPELVDTIVRFSQGK